MSRVGVLGSGEVGQALARGFASRGHEVQIGSRDPAKLAALADAEDRIETATPTETAAFGELLVLATRGDVALTAITQAGPESFAGKVLIDVTNPLSFAEGGPPSLFVGHTDSLGEQIQRHVPDARVVKAFNIITASAMVDPSYASGTPTMFIAGDDDAAKAEVTGVLDAFGWTQVVDAGGIAAARLLEPLCLLWVTVGLRQGAFDHAFALLRG